MSSLSKQRKRSVIKQALYVCGQPKYWSAVLFMRWGKEDQKDRGRSWCVIEIMLRGPFHCYKILLAPRVIVDHQKPRIFNVTNHGCIRGLANSPLPLRPRPLRAAHVQESRCRAPRLHLIQRVKLYQGDVWPVVAHRDNPPFPALPWPPPSLILWAGSILNAPLFYFFIRPL